MRLHGLTGEERMLLPEDFVRRHDRALLAQWWPVLRPPPDDAEVAALEAEEHGLLARA